MRQQLAWCTVMWSAGGRAYVCTTLAGHAKYLDHHLALYHTLRCLQPLLLGPTPSASGRATPKGDFTRKLDQELARIIQ